MTRTHTVQFLFVSAFLLLAALAVSTAHAHTSRTPASTSTSTTKKLPRTHHHDTAARSSSSKRMMRSAERRKQQQQQRHKVGAPIEVHLVPHTHDDVGWLITVDQYYYGANRSIQTTGVQYILDSVIPHLEMNPMRKFVYVEQAFFQRWWNEQDANMKSRVRALVKSGQLTFINGGMVMHDEACTHYIAMIDQTTMGHHFLLREFGVTPNIGWQIDPFGHSATQASLLSAEAGFNGLFFARIDYQDLNHRLKSKRTEFIWRASRSRGASAEIFTDAFPAGNYNAPSGFCFGQTCQDPPIQDDERLEDYNVENRVNAFVAAVEKLASVTRGPIMLTMGSDFQYQNANTWFKNMDKLIKYANRDGRVHAMYSTPAQYLQAKHAMNATWSVKTDDFFPYASGPNAVWAGYFTSRPALKRYVRFSVGYLQAARKLLLMYPSMTTGSQAAPKPTWPITAKLYEATSIAQHHDAVSGTSKQHVAYDYARRIAEGMAQASAGVADTIGRLVYGNSEGISLFQCFRMNISHCPTTQEASSPAAHGFTVSVFNPNARTVTEMLRIPVASTHFKVIKDSTGEAVRFAVSTTPESSSVLAPARNYGPNPGRLIAPPAPSPYILFIEAEVDGLAVTTYSVMVSNSDKGSAAATDAAAKKDEQSQLLRQLEYARTYFDNGVIRVDFSEDGRMQSITNHVANVSVSVSQEWFWYPSMDRPPNSPDHQNSGAYIFRPAENNPLLVKKEQKAEFVVVDGVFWEARTRVTPWLSQTIRLVGNASHVEVEYAVGPLPVEDEVGHELITRFTTSVKSGGYMFTDSNGREVQTRRRDYRPTWPLNVTQPVADNYFPMNAFSYMRDSQIQFSVVTDRSQGVASLFDGSLEIMVHRRILHDDGFGVGEPLNETAGITPYPDPQRLGPGMPIVGRHFLSVDRTVRAMAHVRALASRVYSPLLPVFSNILVEDDGASSETLHGNRMVSPLSSRTISGASPSPNIKALPLNVDLITWQQFPSDSPNTYVFRLAHLFAPGEDPVLSVNATVNVDALFATFIVKEMVAVSLTANQAAGDIQKNMMRWHTEEADVGRAEHKARQGQKERARLEFQYVPGGPNLVTLMPMEIKTFRVTMIYQP